VAPVELAKSYLDRLERFGSRLNAVVTILRTEALHGAAIAEQEIAAGRYRGPLHGIPYGVKDLLATTNAPTTWGAPPYRDQVFDYDATVISKLREAGAILMAKLALVELAGVGRYRYPSASATGPALNPWNIERWAGGSSSGSAAATAAGLVGFSIGSETWGSILIPASFCGITGLRPTYGRVSRFGAMVVSWTMDKLGPMCRSAEDCALVLSAIAGRDYKDESTVNEPFSDDPFNPDLSGIRVGVLQEDFCSNAEPGINEAFDGAVTALANCGARLLPARLPDFPYASIAEIFISAEAACFFENLISSGKIRQLVDSTQQAGIEAGTHIRAVDYLKAMRYRTILKTKFHDFFDSFDVLVTLSFLVEPPPIDAPLDTIFKAMSSVVAAGNLLGLPAISVPCGFGRTELPVGLCITGKPMCDALVLRVARAYQSATNWHRARLPAPPHLNA
jgi:aspartyl-tRNA(Asn)/glutamyl-tRNA(Gln) amidotransferase subunit A